MRAYFERKYTHALAIVRRSGACQKIETLLRDHSQGGAPRALSVEHLLAATITAMDPKLGVVTQVAIHNLLTTVFSPAFHHRHQIPTGLTIRQVRYLFHIITTALDFSPHGKNNQGASKEELKDIEDRTFKLLNAFLRASIPAGLPEPDFMAIDATAIETWARRKASGAFDKDAEYGYRTATYANGSSMFFGHRAIASATCFHKDSPFNKLHLINGQILTSNVGYEPTPTLELLDNHILPHAAMTPTLLVKRSGFSSASYAGANARAWVS
ncbi:MAG TPA: hypothetical protein VK054_02800 [Beutenbergiaceae bacterium]|nr:hypothetical protein [Beutenbergiaceae bacterium]